MNLVSALAFFLLGTVAGAIGLARWWLHAMKKPEVLRTTLAEMHRQAHPHALQVSLHDPTPVCPCCGWTEPAQHAHTKPPGSIEAPKDDPSC